MVGGQPWFNCGVKVGYIWMTYEEALVYHTGWQMHWPAIKERVVTYDHECRAWEETYERMDRQGEGDSYYSGWGT
jgi:hypothetical protein